MTSDPRTGARRPLLRLCRPSPGSLRQSAALETSYTRSGKPEKADVILAEIGPVGLRIREGMQHAGAEPCGGPEVLRQPHHLHGGLGGRGRRSPPLPLTTTTDSGAGRSPRSQAGCGRRPRPWTGPAWWVRTTAVTAQGVESCQLRPTRRRTLIRQPLACPGPTAVTSLTSRRARARRQYGSSSRHPGRCAEGLAPTAFPFSSVSDPQSSAGDESSAGSAGCCWTTCCQSRGPGSRSR